MNVKEKLVELLQSAPADIMGNHGVGALADHLIAHGVTVQEWVPVTERLPEDGGYYLVVHQNKYNGSISIAFEMYIKCKIGEWWENDYAYDVTYWMLLPEMPKEG